VDAALVFADPDILRGSAAGELQLPPLPWARREARGIARTLQLDASHVREGADASEQFLKTAPLTRYSILHFAAHARADAAFPDRSAVFLTPGGTAEDGWLQPREIAALDLGGRLVVLSACESAGGSVLSGEGPLSLARAFFAAGAGAVLATRWPLRDDDAAFVMERFYRALGSGIGAAAALRQARRDAVDAGLPAAAWAGLALLGDGFRPPLTPIAGHRWFSTRSTIVGAGLIGLAIAAAAIGLTRRRAKHTADPV
jgi:CHAT domain-containing protein